MDTWPADSFDEEFACNGSSGAEELASRHWAFSEDQGDVTLDRGNNTPPTKQALDGFDMALLGEPYPDRSWQATNGFARLTLPPEGTHSHRPHHHHIQCQDLSDGDQTIHTNHHALQSENRQSFRSNPKASVIRRSNKRSSSPLFLQSSPSPRTYECENYEKIQELSVDSTRNKAPAPRTRLAAGLMPVEISNIPDQLRGVFPHQHFNAVQSSCFDAAYHKDDNLVMSAPTGSGKTAVLEMAICRLFSAQHDDGPKIVYIAPTKALCSERSRDWSTKFRKMNLECIEVTGDTGATDCFREIRRASIVITTPEKWDSITRKWKDNKALLESFKLFLIDEVHILGEVRGAILEVVVSRMRAFCNSIRFVAISATVQNIEEIAEWLGRDSEHPHLSAQVYCFGEENRPVRLERHVYPVRGTGSVYQFDEICNKHVPAIINRHTRQQPILIFCFTKNSCFATANLLKQKRTSDSRAKSWWKQPRELVQVSDSAINELLAEGLAVHHGGLSAEDRAIIEAGFLSGNIMLICCTSTLAIGVNLPAHLVIIKNTMSFTDEGPREYTDVETIQMIGRAGRPQFVLQGAVAVIMTTEKKAERYERLVAGQEPLESHLSSNLVEHLNAEIFLGTIKDMQTAEAWIRGTFMYPCLRRKLTNEHSAKPPNSSLVGEKIIAMCSKDIEALIKNDLVIRDENQSLRCTRFGEAMARYCIRLPTMRIILAIPRESSVSDILLAITQATELSAIRFRQTDKKIYNDLNSAIGIKYPLGEIKKGSQKAFIIVQVELGGIKPPVNIKSHKINYGYLTDRAVVFNNIHRLARCTIDCKIAAQDAVAVRHGLELARCLSAKVWEESPLQMKQISGIGPVTISKLLQAGIKNIEALEECDPARINMILGASHKGEKFRQELRSFPKLWIQISQVGIEARQTSGVSVNFKIHFGFLNKLIPEYHAHKLVYVCIVTQRSDNLLIDFRRMKASKSSEPICLQTELSDPSQSVECYAMCDELVGTLKHAELKPKLPHGVVFGCKPSSVLSDNMNLNTRRDNSSESTSALHLRQQKVQVNPNDEWFSLDTMTERDLLATEREMETEKIETVDLTNVNCSVTDRHQHSKKFGGKLVTDRRVECNHRCKDKATCRHLCCREGIPDVQKRKPSTNTNIEKKQSSISRLEARAPSLASVTSKDKATQSVNQTPASENTTGALGSEGTLEVSDTGSGKLSTSPSQPAIESENFEWCDLDEALLSFNDYDQATSKNIMTDKKSDGYAPPVGTGDEKPSLGDISIEVVPSFCHQGHSISPDHLNVPPEQSSQSTVDFAGSGISQKRLKLSDERIPNAYYSVDPDKSIERALASRFGPRRRHMSRNAISRWSSRKEDMKPLANSKLIRFDTNGQSLDHHRPEGDSISCFDLGTKATRA